MAPRKSKLPKAKKPPGYSKVRLVDLQASLRERHLPQTGQRAELVERLREDDRRKAAEGEAQHNTASEPPQDATGAPPHHSIAPADDYHGVYTGSAVDTDGKFHHFVRIVGASQTRRGYWRFASIADDRRAYARGLSTPESILVEQDRGQASFDDIILRWIPGTDDPELKRALAGPARDHLSILYELRTLLGQPISFRGQTPVYPISQDPRIKQYWAAKASRQQLKASNGTANVSLPTPAPALDPEPGPSNAQALSNDPPSTSKLPTQPPSTSSPQQNHTLNTRKALEALKLRDEFSLKLPHQPTGSPFTPPARGPSPSTPNQIAHSNTPGSLNTSITHDQHDEITVNESGRPEEASTPLTFKSGSLEDPATLTGAERPSTPYVSKGQIYTPPPTRNPSLPNVSDIFKQAEPTISSSPPQLLPLPSQPAQHALPSPQPREQTPEFDAEQWGGFEQIERDLAALDASYVVLVHTDDAATLVDGNLPTVSLSPVVDTGEINKAVIEHDDGVPIQVPFISADAAIDPAFVAEEETGVMDWEDEAGVVQAAASPLPTRAESPPPAPAGYLDIPCMDCGLMEAEGHASDCHIGNMTFSGSLNILDHRRLADAVEHFDPSPWTTHFDPYPTQPPEDPDTQIRGMADIIRNEDTYKNDAELHGLPDSAMVLLWAFKTLPDVHIVTE